MTPHEVVIGLNDDERAKLWEAMVTDSVAIMEHSESQALREIAAHILEINGERK